MNNLNNQKLLKDTNLELIEEESLNILIDKDITDSTVDMLLYSVFEFKGEITILPQSLSQFYSHYSTITKEEFEKFNDQDFNSFNEYLTELISFVNKSTYQEKRIFQTYKEALTEANILAQSQKMKVNQTVFGNRNEVEKQYFPNAEIQELDSFYYISCVLECDNIEKEDLITFYADFISKPNILIIDIEDKYPAVLSFEIIKKLSQIAEIKNKISHFETEVS